MGCALTHSPPVAKRRLGELGEWRALFPLFLPFAKRYDNASPSPHVPLSLTPSSLPSTVLSLPNQPTGTDLSLPSLSSPLLSRSLSLPHSRSLSLLSPAVRNTYYALPYLPFLAFLSLIRSLLPSLCTLSPSLHLSLPPSLFTSLNLSPGAIIERVKVR